MSDNKKPEVPSYVRFGIAGLSGMGATLFVQPLDLVKTRMQLSGEGGKTRDHKTSLHAIRSIVEKEGVIGLYSGLSANLFRQATYTTCRMGIYQVTLDHLKNSGYQQGLPIQIAAGLAGGFVAAFVATPSDVRRSCMAESEDLLARDRVLGPSYDYGRGPKIVRGPAKALPPEVALVRMTANGRLPESERRNYKNIFDALRRIAVEEGRKGVFAGLQATILRAMVANTAQLVSYGQAKQFLLSKGYMKDNIKCHFVSSLFSGLIYTTSTCPLDVAKTRMQYMKTETGDPLYKNIGDALSKTVKKEGVTALWKGFVPLYTRCAPHTVLLLIFSEQLTSSYLHYFNENSQ